MDPIEVSSSDELKVNINKMLVAAKIRDGQEDGLRYTDSDGLASSYDRKPNGQAIYGVQGVIPSGQAVELPAARVFVEHLNSDQRRWGEPYRYKGPENGIDCVAIDLCGGRPLYMQVSLGLCDPAFWEAQKRSSERKLQESSLNDRVSDLWLAAKKKEHKARKDTILLLSALLLLAHGTSIVAGQFRSTHGKQARELGFKGVWVVGPDAAHVFQLDIEPTTD